MRVSVRGVSGFEKISFLRERGVRRSFSLNAMTDLKTMRRIVFAAFFVFFRLISLGPIGASDANEVHFAAVLNASADNSTAVILEAIRYTVSQVQSLIAPHTIVIDELQVDPEPEFALEPFAQLFLFTATPNRTFHGAIDGTVDGLAKYFLSNASVREVTFAGSYHERRHAPVAQLRLAASPERSRATGLSLSWPLYSFSNIPRFMFEQFRLVLYHFSLHVLHQLRKTSSLAGEVKSLESCKCFGSCF